MALTRAHTSMKETIRVAVTGISGSGRSSGDSLTNNKKTALILIVTILIFFYLRDALSAVLARQRVWLGGWDGWLAGWVAVRHTRRYCIKTTKHI